MQIKQIEKIDDLMSLPRKLDIGGITFYRVKESPDLNRYKWECLLSYNGWADFRRKKSGECKTPLEALHQVLEELTKMM